MSNFNKPTFKLPGSAPPAPLSPPPNTPHQDLLAKFPLPWCVGPDGYLWVAADVVKITNPDDRRPGDSEDGWRATGSKARLVLEHKLPADIAAFVLSAVNGRQA